MGLGLVANTGSTKYQMIQEEPHEAVAFKLQIFNMDVSLLLAMPPSRGPSGLDENS